MSFQGGLADASLGAWWSLQITATFCSESAGRCRGNSIQTHPASSSIIYAIYQLIRSCLFIYVYIYIYVYLSGSLLSSLCAHLFLCIELLFACESTPCTRKISTPTVSQSQFSIYVSLSICPYVHTSMHLACWQIACYISLLNDMFWDAIQRQEWGGVIFSCQHWHFSRAYVCLCPQSRWQKVAFAHADAISNDFQPFWQFWASFLFHVNVIQIRFQWPNTVHGSAMFCMRRSHDTAKNYSHHE